MKIRYLEPNLTFVKFTTDVIKTSEVKPYDFGDGDWGVEDDFV